MREWGSGLTNWRNDQNKKYKKRPTLQKNGQTNRSFGCLPERVRYHLPITRYHVYVNIYLYCTSCRGWSVSMIQPSFYNYDCTIVPSLPRTHTRTHVSRRRVPNTEQFFSATVTLPISLLSFFFFTDPGRNWGGQFRLRQVKLFVPSIYINCTHITDNNNF